MCLRLYRLVINPRKVCKYILSVEENLKVRQIKCTETREYTLSKLTLRKDMSLTCRNVELFHYATAAALGRGREKLQVVNQNRREDSQADDVNGGPCTTVTEILRQKLYKKKVRNC